MISFIENALSAVNSARAAIVTGLACTALCLPLGYCKGYEAAKSKAVSELALANVTAVTTARGADDVAAVERLGDALANAKQHEDLTDAISEVPDSAPDAVRVALGCQRLRATGRAEATLPAACRPAGSDGSEAVAP